MTQVKSTNGAAGGSTSLRHRHRPFEIIIKGVLIVAALISILTTIAIVISLINPTVGFFDQVTFKEFFTGSRWTPTLDPKAYGILPLLVATLISTLIAVGIAIPLGLGVAIYLAEYAADRTRKVLKPVLEILAGVPTVVYGFFALTALNPVLREL